MERHSFLKTILPCILLLTGLIARSQYYEERPYPEIGLGVKIIKGDIIYGPRILYTTDKNSIALQGLFRYDYPIKISGISPYQQRYINLVIESGFLFCKTKVFDTVYVDPTTNLPVHDKSKKNPAYFPLYAGLSTRNTLSVGTELFYWKGLGTRDIWGAKFLSVSYNATNFRISASGEWYTQTKNATHNGLLLSVDFWWKLIIRK